MELAQDGVQWSHISFFVSGISEVEPTGFYIRNVGYVLQRCIP
jgi:hypothetical protein